MAIQTFTLDPNAAALENGKIAVRNETGGTLAEGELVYVSGWDVANGEFLISKAEAPSSDAHLAQFVMRAALVTAASGFAFKSHTFTGQDTSTGVVGDPVYLSATPGEFTLIKPSFAQQVVGRVAVVDPSVGEVEFLLLSDSDSGFVRSNPDSGEFPVSGVRRTASGDLEVEFDDVAIV